MGRSWQRGGEGLGREGDSVRVSEAGAEQLRVRDNHHTMGHSIKKHRSCNMYHRQWLSTAPDLFGPSPCQCGTDMGHEELVLVTLNE